MKLDRYILWRFVEWLVLCAMLVFFGVFYRAHFEQKEQMQLFLFDGAYLIKHLQEQGGLAIWLGEFFTQFFHIKSVGAILTTMLLCSFHIAIRALMRKLFSKSWAILALFPVIGYFLLLTNDYYLLSGLIAMNVAVWAACFYTSLNASLWRLLWGNVILIALYWLMGGAYIVFVMLVLFMEIDWRISRNDKSLKTGFVFSIITYLSMLVIVPLFARQFLITDTLLMSFFSRAYYQFSFVIPLPLLILFLSVPALLVVVRFLSGAQNRFYAFVQIVLALVAISGLVAGIILVPNYSEEREMRYDNLVQKQDWQGIIECASKHRPEGKISKSALFLALGKSNQLSSRLFEFEPVKADLFIPYNVHGMAPPMANEPYYHLGLINFSKILCIETIESTPNSVMPVRSMKRFAENCLISGQYDVAAKYLGYLQKTIFYRTWATEAMGYLNNEAKLNQDTEWGALRAKQVRDDFYFNYKKPEIALLSLLRSNNKNQLAYEYLMACFLLDKDFDEFLKYLPLCKTFNYPELPLVYQEALAYIATLLPEVPESFQQYHISEQVITRLDQYAEAFQNGGSNNPQAMKKNFGTTYWYYIHFIEKNEVEKN